LREEDYQLLQEFGVDIVSAGLAKKQATLLEGTEETSEERGFRGGDPLKKARSTLLTQKTKLLCVITNSNGF